MNKEVEAYEKEVEVNEARIQKMRDDGKDPYGLQNDIRVMSHTTWIYDVCYIMIGPYVSFHGLHVT